MRAVPGNKARLPTVKGEITEAKAIEINLNGVIKGTREGRKNKTKHGRGLKRDRDSRTTGSKIL